MLLTPHHFQQWDNYYEEVLAARLAALAPYEWGVLNLQVDRDAVANGTVRLARCRAVLPDGLLFDIPETDPEPAPRQIEGHFSSEEKQLDIYLGLPAKRLGAANFYQSQNNGNQPLARFRQEAGSVVDETTGDNAQLLAFARGDFRLLFGDELSKQDGYTTLKIAEIMRSDTGQLRVWERYVPPALSITVSPWLVNTLRQIIEILITKSGTLSEQRRQSQTGLAEFTTSNVGVFWLLHTVNSALPTLAHLSRTQPSHPERLYLALANLVGTLMTFAPNRHPKEIIAYDHKNLYQVFNWLAIELRDLLEIVIPDKCVPIRLENVRPTIHLGRIEDEQLLRDAVFYLGVRAEIEAGRLIDVAPKVIKIAAYDEIDRVIGVAIPGVPLLHVSPPPPALRVHERFQYFRLERPSPFWDTIRGSKTIAVHVPDKIPEAKLELYAIKP